MVRTAQHSGDGCASTSAASASTAPGGVGMAAPRLLEVGIERIVARNAAFVFVKEFFDDVESSTKAIAGCPKISAVVEAFGKLPEVKQWQESRPKTMF